MTKPSFKRSFREENVLDSNCCRLDSAGEIDVGISLRLGIQIISILETKRNKVQKEISNI